MTRATRFASYTAAVTLCYFLAWFSIIPIPFIAEETKNQIIPLVRTLLNHSFPNSRPVVELVLIAASVVDTGVVRVLFAGVARMGVVVIQGLPGCV